MQSNAESTEIRPHRVSNLVLCFTSSCTSGLLARHRDAHSHSTASRSSRVPLKWLAEVAVLTQLALLCTAPTSNLLKSHARHGLRSSKASSMIRANFTSKEKEEEHPTLAGVCPRVSGHVKSQGSRSQPSLTSTSGNPEFAASRYSSVKHAW